MERPGRGIAVIDIGKTNAKVALVDAATGSELALRSAPTTVRREEPYPHLDAAPIWEFVGDALAEIGRQAPVDAISIAGHGSAGALLRADPEGDGLALPILDYEHDGPDELAAEYDSVRPAFAETFSPRLPGGLNLGAQLFWQQRRFPHAFATGARYVNYPQYWAWRLSGVAATEMCSMGAHSDLWDPRALGWSSLVDRMGWTALMAPPRSAFNILGPLRPAVAKQLGLDPATPVLCGIHDSSASLLPHLKEREPPFTIVSTGTWVILFAVGADLEKLDPARDTLANVTAFGRPVACARFMGGREFETIAGVGAAPPSPPDIAAVLRRGVMALPTFAPGNGPFAARRGAWTHEPATLTAAERSAAAALYCALVTAESMAAAGASGPVVVEGPFARNELYCGALAAIVGRAVLASRGRAGTTRGAAMLAVGDAMPAVPADECPPFEHPDLRRYAREWGRAARR